jgi:hypothetical protein
MSPAGEGIEGMRELNLAREDLEIREVVVEASRALAQLDANRLEELALACEALIRQREPLNVGSDGRKYDGTLARQAREAVGDMKTFGRVLEATRANLTVIRRLRRLHAGHVEYSEAQARGWAPPEPGYGDN